MKRQPVELVKVGFGSASLRAALPCDHPVRDDVMARAFHAQSPHARSTNTRALWVVLDLMDLNRPFVERVRDEVARGTGVSPGHVHVVATHNHAASDLAHLDAGAAARAAASAASEAVDASQPAHMRFAQAQVEPALSLTRRREIAELGGAISCFYGVTAADDLSCERILRQAVRSLVHTGRMAYSDQGLTEPVPQERFIDARLAADPKAWRMPGGDPLLQALRFETEDGTPLGTIVRFACHVVNCNGQGFYSGDFPFFLTRSLQERLGGGSLFLNGPCADIAPGTPDKRAGFEQTMGERLAEVAATALEGQAPEPLTLLRDLTWPVRLPCRRDFPRNADQEDRRTQQASAARPSCPGHRTLR